MKFSARKQALKTVFLTGFSDHNFSEKVNEALAIFKSTPEAILTEKRFVGRKQLPSSVIGLYFHAAEHSQRHIGQMLVTISVLKERF